MLYPKNNPVAKWIFKVYVKRLVNKQFHQFLFNAIEVDSNKSILLVANHFSFWDGLILYCLNDRLFKKHFHVMILHDTAKSIGALRYGGAFSVNKGSKDIVESLNYAAQLLNDPNNLVLMFPQGKLYSNFVDRIKFEKGIIRLVERAKNYQLIFVATFIQYLQHKKPTVTLYLKNQDSAAVNDINTLQINYQQHFDKSKQQQTEIVL
ncbi:MAG: glycerol acyltransferase [Sphingobacteriaceae bacterium]|nr:MAG: glycerol acyltransferase [Sphingobacteriaceae bacterium]